MAVPANSAQSWRAAFTGSYDDEEIAFLVPYIAPGSLVLDVGASLGFYTIPLALAAREVGARVLAIEPVGRNCEAIRRNVALNGLEDTVSVMQCALGSAPSTVTLHVESGGSGNATIVTGLDPAEVERHDRAGNTGSTEVVSVERLDAVEFDGTLAGRSCSLMKLDAEGFELDILLGASSFLQVHRPVLFAEFNDSWLHTRGVPSSAPAQWAADNGYSCHELIHTRVSRLSDVQRLTLRRIGPADHRSGSDLLLRPENKAHSN